MVSAAAINLNYLQLLELRGDLRCRVRARPDEPTSRRHRHFDAVVFLVPRDNVLQAQLVAAILAYRGVCFLLPLLRSVGGAVSRCSIRLGRMINGLSWYGGSWN